MADTQLKDLPAVSSLNDDDIFYVVVTPDTTPTDNKITKANLATTLGAEANTMSSAGGISIVLAKSGVDLPIKGFTAGTGITITANANDLEIISKPLMERSIAVSDESTPIGATGILTTFRNSFPFTLRTGATDVTVGIRASLTTPCTTGTFTVDVLQGGVSILSTLITIDATEKTSFTASILPVISTFALTDDSEMTINVTNIGDGTATGLKVYLIGNQT